MRLFTFARFSLQNSRILGLTSHSYTFEHRSTDNNLNEHRTMSVSHRVAILYFVCALLISDVYLLNNTRENWDAKRNRSKWCVQLRCGSDERCIQRRFWCQNPPCPIMQYCAKSNKDCEREIARCITEKDFYEGPATCIGFQCPSEYRCILRESLCLDPPCKLLESCAPSRDVEQWLSTCKLLGCLSEYDCFLRSQVDNRLHIITKHIPDCITTNASQATVTKYCLGWICPRGLECSIKVQGTCNSDNCRVERFCHGPLHASQTQQRSNIESNFQPSSVKTLAQIEHELILKSRKDDRNGTLVKNRIVPGMDESLYLNDNDNLWWTTIRYRKKPERTFFNNDEPESTQSERLNVAEVDSISLQGQDANANVAPVTRPEQDWWTFFRVEKNYNDVLDYPDKPVKIVDEIGTFNIPDSSLF
ncbi:uncharacterized protein [Prorops nasuta]|uniref:uncharacterized protein isoform X2 n=1 Tax=Prorops nasuta TaxID=863751 RepID=UPI0034D00B5C